MVVKRGMGWSQANLAQYRSTLRVFLLWAERQGKRDEDGEGKGLHKQLMVLLVERERE